MASAVLQVCHREKARTADQTSKASNEAAIYIGERLDKLIEDAAKRELALAERTFAASRTMGRRDRGATGGARPRLGLGHRSTSVERHCVTTSHRGIRGCCCAAVGFPISAPESLLYEMVVGAGSEIVVQAAFAALGSVLLAFAGFDFRTSRWIPVTGLQSRHLAPLHGTTGRSATFRFRGGAVCRSSSGLDRDRAFYPTVAIVEVTPPTLSLPSWEHQRVPGLESLVAGLSLQGQYSGFRRRFGLLSLRWVHTVFSTCCPAASCQSGVPRWWPACCHACEATARVHAWLLTSGRVRAVIEKSTLTARNPENLWPRKRESAKSAVRKIRGIRGS